VLAVQGVEVLVCRLVAPQLRRGSTSEQRSGGSCTAEEGEFFACRLALASGGGVSFGGPMGKLLKKEVSKLVKHFEAAAGIDTSPYLPAALRDQSPCVSQEGKVLVKRVGGGEAG
jgi:hypothetical protein